MYPKVFYNTHLKGYMRHKKPTDRIFLFNNYSISLHFVKPTTPDNYTSKA